jgi:hypothetical protein
MGTGETPRETVKRGRDLRTVEWYPLELRVRRMRRVWVTCV